jgi:hypothetical protein
MGAERLFWSPSKNGSWLNGTMTFIRNHEGMTERVNVQKLDADTRVTVESFRPKKGEDFIHVEFDVPVRWSDTDEA